MALIDIKIPAYIARALKLPARDARGQQVKVLRRLLDKARFTQFGQLHRFDEILLDQHPDKLFQKNVPLYDYSRIYNEWWYKAQEGTPDVCWPGVVKYFALSSGTSEASSKYIPITNDLMRGNRIIMIKQLLSLRTYHDIPVKSISKGWLMLGGSTDLQKVLETGVLMRAWLPALLIALALQGGCRKAQFKTVEDKKAPPATQTGGDGSGTGDGDINPGTSDNIEGKKLLVSVPVAELPFGGNSTTATAKLKDGSSAVVEWKAVDPTGKPLGTITPEGVYKTPATGT
ncbi:MAG: hypothetical protein EOO04_34065, partial [Chitinophagaceae bacterium]